MWTGPGSEHRKIHQLLVRSLWMWILRQWLTITEKHLVLVVDEAHRIGMVRQSFVEKVFIRINCFVLGVVI